MTARPCRVAEPWDHQMAIGRCRSVDYKWRMVGYLMNVIGVAKSRQVASDANPQESVAHAADAGRKDVSDANTQTQRSSAQ